MKYLLRRESKSDDTYEHVLEVHLEKKDIRTFFKKKQRFTINMKDVEAQEDVPIKLSEVILIATVKEKRRNRGDGKKVHDRSSDKGEKT